MTYENACAGGLFAQIHSLVTLELNGEMSPAEQARLEELVCTSAAARRLYVRYIAETAALQRCVGLAASEVGEAVSLVLPVLPAESFGQPSGNQPQSKVLGFLSAVLDSIQASPRLLGTLVLGGLGTYFAVVLTTLVWHRVWHDPQPEVGAPAVAVQADGFRPGEIARLVAAHDCRWQTYGSAAAAEGVGPIAGAVLDSEPLRLTAGMAVIEFATGARVVLEAPAEFVPQSAGRSLLTRGRLVAHVPARATGFTVATPMVEVIDLGTEFGVQVDDARSTDVHVLRGEVEVKRVGATAVEARPGLRLTAGNAVHLTAGLEATSIPVNQRRFSDLAATAALASATGAGQPERKSGPVGTVWLGNLFDDAKGTPLDEALRTDRLRATPTLGTLGVYGVTYGGNTVVAITPEVTLDLENLGWGGNIAPHLIANDAWKDSEAFGPAGGLRLDGEPMGLNEPRMHDGIGMHADALVTFDLDEIRAAGHLEHSKLEFRCDRGGINDSGLDGQDLGTIHLLALVSTKTGRVRGWVDGEAAEMTKQIHQWRMTSAIGKPLRPGGPYFSLRIPLEPEDKYLTLISACAGDGIQLDHGAWLGARLEVQPLSAGK